MGPAIATAFDFSITNRLADIEAERTAQEMMGYESEDEREVENHMLPPPVPLDAWSASSPDLSPLTPIYDPVQLLAVPPMLPLPSPSTSATPAHASAHITSPRPSTKKPRHKKTDHHKAGAKKCQLKQRLQHMEKAWTVLKVVNVRRRKNLNPIPTNTDAANLNHASTAWIGKPENFDRVHYSLDRLTGSEFNFVKHTWDGK
jgi:hypothetical protein